MTPSPKYRPTTGPFSYSAAPTIAGTVTKPSRVNGETIQLNWVTGADVVTSEQRRHALATRVKKLKAMFLPMAG